MNTISNVNFHVVPSVHTAPEHSQKRDLSPGSADCYCRENKLKYVKSVSCVTQLSCVKPVTNVKNVASNLPVGARLQDFWQTWLDLGAGPKVVQILKEGYTLPFGIRPKLTRSPRVISCYVNPNRNLYLLEALHQLIDKNAVELVQNQTSLGFFNRLFLVPKPNNKWRPILDLSKLNLFLKAEKFKMETPETIRTSLQPGEWVTSIDFKDTYFHIPIQEQSRKYLRFHVQGQTYQFKALPFGLSTAPLEFTVVAQEVKLMAIHKGIRIHQYLDDWLVRARSHQVCFQHTQDLVCQKLGWLVNLEKSELEPKQIFDFVGYQFNLRAGRVRPTPDRWQNLQDKILEIRNTVTTGLYSPAVHVPDRFINSHTKASLPRPTAHETHTVASQKQLEGTRVTRKGDYNFQVSAPPLTMVAKRRQCSHRSAITPNKTRSANIYRCIKRRVGRSLKRTHCKRVLVTSRKQAAYKLSGTKSSLSSLERVSRPLYRQDSTCGNQQYYSSVIHKQGRRHEVGPTLCPMENLDLLYQEASNSRSPTHSRPAERGSRQANQTRPDHPNRVVSPSRGLPNNMQQVAPASNRPICHEIQQVTSVCVTGTRFPGHSGGCTQSAIGGSRLLCLPTSSHLGQSGGEVVGLPMQENHSDCSRVAQHALVLEPSGHV